MDGHSPVPTVVDVCPRSALLLNPKSRLISPRPPWLPSLALAARALREQGSPPCSRALIRGPQKPASESTPGFPPLLSLDDLLFCEICESGEIYSAPRPGGLRGKQKTKGALDLDQETKIEILGHLISRDRLQPPR